MEFSIKAAHPDECTYDCVTLGIFEDGSLTKAASAIDKRSGGILQSLHGCGDISGKIASHRLLFNVPGIAAKRVLVIGLGKKDRFAEQQWRIVVKTMMMALLETKIASAIAYFTDLPANRQDARWKAKTFVVAASDASYAFDRLKSSKGRKPTLSRLSLGTQGTAETALALGLKEGISVSAGMTLAKDLANLPGNVCTPTYLANEAVAIGKKYDIKVEILDQGDMKKVRMGALLAVARGSKEQPKFVVARYLRGERNSAPIVLVGKGITFDSGGISLKPGPGMDEMKFDMCGAAAVLGTLVAIAKLNLKLNVIGLIPAAENMPGGAANKPGDIIRSLSGQTIEVLNTDAEGRLILCDALTYAERFKPSAVIDIATLTGACVIALGHVNSGLFANDTPLAQELISAGLHAADPAWLMPLSEEYEEDLKSNFADFANVGGRAAGSITAAAFLGKFSKQFKWAHLDIAGTAWRSGSAKGATGRPVPLLVQYLIKASDSSRKRS